MMPRDPYVQREDERAAEDDADARAQARERADRAAEKSGLTPEQIEALEHVREIEADGSKHSLTSCPPFTRAMCRYRKVLSAMERR